MKNTNNETTKTATRSLLAVFFAVVIFISTATSAFAYTGSSTLFNPSKGKYNYCPVGIQAGSDLYIAYCTNSKSNVIYDNIGMRVMNSNGSVGKEKIIASPTNNAWDSTDVCDPSIIAGSFNYLGTTYSYLMAFLGCDTTDCQKNQIGFAVSNSLTSGWIKCDAINPVVSHSYDASQSNLFQWGVGQPSLINLDGNGNILLFYTSGTCYETCTYVVSMNVSDLGNIQRNATAKVTNNGLGDFLSNGDFAFDGDYLYVACDTHPFAAGILGNISNQESIFKMAVSNRADVNSYANGTWELVTRIGGETTGHVKNHNGGFVRDIYGNLTAEHAILVSVADEKSDWLSSLWSYRINAVNF